MIKAFSSKENLMLLGLSAENIRRLQSGMPIRFNLRELNQGEISFPDMTVVILAGETEETIAASIGVNMHDMPESVQ